MLTHSSIAKIDITKFVVGFITGGCLEVLGIKVKFSLACIGRRVFHTHIVVRCLGISVLCLLDHNVRLCDLFRWAAKVMAW